MTAVPARLAIAALAACSHSACVPIPIADDPPFHDEAVGELGPGSTRADVLFALGAPNFAHDEDRVFVYSGAELKMAYVFVLGAETAGGVGGGTIGRRFAFAIEFDEAGMLLDSEAIDLGLGFTDGGLTDPGYRGIACTGWDLCFRDGGAVLLRPPAPVEYSEP